MCVCVCVCVCVRCARRCVWLACVEGVSGLCNNGMFEESKEDTPS